MYIQISRVIRRVKSYKSPIKEKQEKEYNFSIHQKDDRSKRNNVKTVSTPKLKHSLEASI